MFVLLEQEKNVLFRMLVNFLLIIPLTAVLEKLVYYLFGCPCLYDAEMNGDATYKRNAKVLKYTGNVLVLPIFLFSLLCTIATPLVASSACIIAMYIWSNILLVGLLDVLKSLPHYVWSHPFRIKTCGLVVFTAGAWAIERQQERLFQPNKPIVKASSGEDIKCACCCTQIVTFDPFFEKTPYVDAEAPVSEAIASPERTVDDVNGNS